MVRANVREGKWPGAQVGSEKDGETCGTRSMRNGRRTVFLKAQIYDERAVPTSPYSHSKRDREQQSGTSCSRLDAQHQIYTYWFCTEV